MIDRLNIWLSSKPWFWKIRTWFGRGGFLLERSVYKSGTTVTKAGINARIFKDFTWIGVKGLFWITLGLLALILVENYERNNLSWLKQFSAHDNSFNIEQLRLYAQLLTAIFSIYFATIGIILSAGYTRLRSDIIWMLTNEQVGSVYSRALVLAAMFCLAATSLPLFGLDTGLLVYSVGTFLTLTSALALFPLGQRLFNFFDLTQLVRSEIIPNIVRHIEGAANPKNSISLANHHSRATLLALDQLSYIDERVKTDIEGIEDNLPSLSDGYTSLLLHYLQQKHKINQESYWFPRRREHEQWFLAGDIKTSTALQTSSQLLQVEEKPDHEWFENKIVDRLAGHIELAFQLEDFDLALKLIESFSFRGSVYAAGFQFDIGMQELKKIKEIIEYAFTSSGSLADDRKRTIMIDIADTWAALGSQLCLETLRRMFTFENDLKQFLESDEWSEKSLRRLPAFLQVELAIIVERIEFEQEVEGLRLSKPKYVQQLAVQRLLRHYAQILPVVCNFYENMVPDFVASLSKLKMPEAATQVLLASLHAHWKLPRWFEDLSLLFGRYQEYRHYDDELYTLPKIDTEEMSKQIASARDDAITMLGDGAMVSHIFQSENNDKIPDHFGQIYFELAEACIDALEDNDESKLEKVLPMFLILAILAADSKFADPSFDVNDEFRLHLVSTVINDLASILGFAIIYGAYFGNEKLSEGALAQFQTWIEKATNKQQYLERMVRLSNPHIFSMSASPRDLIRINWKMSFEHLVREDGFGDQMSKGQGKEHPNKVVREFLRSNSDASHLFFADQIVPQLESLDFEVDRYISDLAHGLREDNDEVGNEDH